MPLPLLKRLFPGDATPLGKMEENLAEYASALTGQRGLLARGLTFREHVLCDVLKAEAVAVPDLAAWQPLTFGPSWSQWDDSTYPPAGLRINPGSGLVEARGLVRRNLGTDGVICTYPSSWASEANLLLGVTSAGGFGTVIVGPAGPNVYYLYGDAANWVSLDGVRWPLKSYQPTWPTETQRLLRLGPSFKAQPGSVQLLDARGTDGSRYAGLPVRWRPENIGQFPGVRILYVDGLPPGTYTLTFLVLPE